MPVRYGFPQNKRQPEPPIPPIIDPYGLSRAQTASIGRGMASKPGFQIGTLQVPQVQYGGGAGNGTPGWARMGSKPGFGNASASIPTVTYGPFPAQAGGGGGGSSGVGGPGDVAGGNVNYQSVNNENPEVATMQNWQQRGGVTGGITYGNPQGQPQGRQVYGDWRDVASQYGIDPKRVVNVYMNPNDPNASDNPYNALSNAISDDVWARAASQAFGRPPNQQEWVEHYNAKNYGRRDPLEGHPAAVQYIQGEAERMHQANVQAAQQAAQQLFNEQQSQIYQ